MKNKLELTASITLDEIQYQLVENLSMKELIGFVVGLGNNMSESETYWIELHKKTETIVKQLK